MDWHTFVRFLIQIRKTGPKPSMKLVIERQALDHLYMVYYLILKINKKYMSTSVSLLLWMWMRSNSLWQVSTLEVKLPPAEQHNK